MQCDKTSLEGSIYYVYHVLIAYVLTMSLVHKKILLVNFWNPKWPIDLKWPEMRSKVNFGHPKWPKAAILSKKKSKKKDKVAYRSEMARNASDLNNVRTDCWLTTNWYQYIYIYIQTAMLGTREYTLCSPFRANVHNSSFDRHMYFHCEHFATITYLHDFQFKSYGSNSGFNVFDDLDLDIWHMFYWRWTQVNIRFFCGVGKIESLEHTMFPCMVCLLEQ